MTELDGILAAVDSAFWNASVWSDDRFQPRQAFRAVKMAEGRFRAVPVGHREGLPADPFSLSGKVGSDAKGLGERLALYAKTQGFSSPSGLELTIAYAPDQHFTVTVTRAIE